MAKYDNNNNPYSWMPGFLRRFLNLDYDPAQSAESSQAGPSYAPPSVATVQTAWVPSSEPTFKASSMEGYRAPSVASFTPPAGFTPPPANGTSAAPSVGVAPIQFDSQIQPISYALRGFLHGVLPPQGLEAFAKEVRTTTTDVWNLYSRWFSFQTDEPLLFVRSIIDAVTAGATALTPNGSVATARRIKVTVANGNDSDPADSAAK